jgi:hypothetical protein
VIDVSRIVVVKVGVPEARIASLYGRIERAEAEALAGSRS